MRSARMVNDLGASLRQSGVTGMGATGTGERFLGRKLRRRPGLALGLAAAVLLLSAIGFGQGSPRVTGVEPGSGKVNDSVTLAGENLGKGSIIGVYLSDEKTDYKATLADQAADKVVFKGPQVKGGDYNVSIQVGNNILIQPIRFKVQE